MKNTKQLLTKPSVIGSTYTVKYEGGGELPRDLSGVYTSEKEAQKAINLYLIKKNRDNEPSSSK